MPASAFDLTSEDTEDDTNEEVGADTSEELSEDTQEEDLAPALAQSAAENEAHA